MKLQFIKLLQEVRGHKGLHMAPAVCLGFFILKMPVPWPGGSVGRSVVPYTKKVVGLILGQAYT